MKYQQDWWRKNRIHIIWILLFYAPGNNIAAAANSFAKFTRSASLVSLFGMNMLNDRCGMRRGQKYSPRPIRDDLRNIINKILTNFMFKATTKIKNYVCKIARCWSTTIESEDKAIASLQQSVNGCPYWKCPCRVRIQSKYRAHLLSLTVRVETIAPDTFNANHCPVTSSFLPFYKPQMFLLNRLLYGKTGFAIKKQLFKLVFD